MKPGGKPPDTLITCADIHSTDDNIPQPPRRNITKISRPESNRRFKPDCAIAVINYTKPDTKYIHNILKSDTWYWEDESLTVRVYHFLNKLTVEETMTLVDKSKMSPKVKIRLGRDIEVATRESTSDTRGSTSDDTDKESESNDWKTKTRKIRI